MNYKFKIGDKVRFKQQYLSCFPPGMKATIKDFYTDFVSRPCYLIAENLTFYITEDVLELDGPRPKKGFGLFIESKGL